MKATKGVIAKNGVLKISRAGEMETQWCPKDTDECGHWCPLFGEPEPVLGSPTTELKICETTWYFDEFVDERGGA